MVIISPGLIKTGAFLFYEPAKKIIICSQLRCLKPIKDTTPITPIVANNSVLFLLG